MKCRLLVNALIAGTMLAAAPVWAHGGHGKGHWKQWEKHHRHGYHHHHHPAYRERVIVRRYVERAPVYYGHPLVAPAPGVHIVTPSIFIPWPR